MAADRGLRRAGWGNLRFRVTEDRRLLGRLDTDERDDLVGARHPRCDRFMEHSHLLVRDDGLVARKQRMANDESQPGLYRRSEHASWRRRYRYRRDIRDVPQLRVHPSADRAGGP